MHILLLTVVSSAVESAAADDYSFDTTGLEIKPFDASVSMEFYPSMLYYNKTAPLYTLRFGADDRSASDNYNLKTEGYLHYQRKRFFAFGSGALYGDYVRKDDSLSGKGKLYEGYLKYTPDPSLSFLLGKRLFQWGKGYSFNPVAFAGRMKNLNDIGASLEGYWNISCEYIKSYDSPMSTIAFNAVILPVYDVINEDYLPDTSIAGLAQLYLLLLNTDMDIYFLGDNRKNIKTGLDFSRNPVPNWEIHGEWAFVKNVNFTVFSDESTMVTHSHRANNLVAGTRYLAAFNTTFILEYLHIGSGYTQDEMAGYWNAVNYAVTSSNPRRMQSVLKATSRYFNAQFMTTDYLFFKASHPDPFNFVYFTPSVYTFVNISDRSMMTGIEMTYNRSKHLLLTGRYTSFRGKTNSEYGSKPARHRIELRVKWSF
jgi:hypothetical protein